MVNNLQMLEHDVHQHNVFLGLNAAKLPPALALHRHHPSDHLGNVVVFDSRSH